MTAATCHTDGCPNAEITIDVETTYTDPDTGETMTVEGVICGVCGNPITDLVADPGSDAPPW